MRRRLQMFFMAAVVFAMVSGCGGPKPADAPLEAPGDLQYEKLHASERFRKYKSVGLKPFDASNAVLLSTDPDEQTETQRFVETAGRKLEQGFLDEMKDNYYGSFGIVGPDDDPAKYDLIIEGKFLEFDRGNRAARYLTGGGWTHVSIVGTMTETATGTVVVDFRDTKFGTGGAFGGDSIDLLAQNCDETGGNISDFLEEVY
ncbi:MAG TPA: DUF4410 domain-containing protein [Nitrospirota bacterium]|jgi:hypothetical protein